jgi:RHS repeat-associated protein
MQRILVPTKLYRVLAAVLTMAVVLGLADIGVAQTPETGRPNWSAYASNKNDTINLSNLNVVVNIPAMAKSGLFPISASLVENSSVYLNTVYLEPAVGLNVVNAYFPIAVNNLFTDGVGPGVVYSVSTANVSCPSSGTTTKYSNWIVLIPDGTRHPLPTSDYADSAGCLTGSGFTNAISIDGSGFIASVSATGTPTALHTSVGTSVGSTSITDSNGNSINYVASSYTYKDTMGEPEFVMNSQVASKITWPTLSNGTASVSETNTSYPLRSNFGCSGLTDYNISAAPLTTSILFEDNSTIAVVYEPTPSYSSDVTGRISELTLRTGGTIKYNYNPTSGSNEGLNCTYAVPTALTRTTSGAGSGETSYSIAWQSSGGSCSASAECSQTTVLDPGLNKTVYYFSAGWGAAAPAIVALTQVQRYQNTGTLTSPAYTLLTTDIYCYQSTFSYLSSPQTTCSQASVGLPVTYVSVYHQEGASKYSMREIEYDSYGNTLLVNNYDFGSSTVGMSESITYGTWSGSCGSIGTYIQDKPCQIVTSLGGTTSSTSRFTYDTKGNLTKTSVLTGGTTFIGQTSPNTYNSNGTIATRYDLANNVTTYTYASGGYSDCGSLACTSLTSYPFPTKITYANGLYSSATWDGLGGVKLTDVDVNSRTTTYGYDTGPCGSELADPVWRLGSETDPNMNDLCLSADKDFYPYEMTLYFGSSVYDKTVSRDGYGRVIDTQTAQSNAFANFDTVSTTYSWPSSTNAGYYTVFRSVPCSATSVGAFCGSSYGLTTLYDVLGRAVSATESGTNGVTYYIYNVPTSTSTVAIDTSVSRQPAPSWDGEHVKSVEVEHNGLGQLTRGCAINQSGGGNACGMAFGASVSGILTTYAYSEAAAGSYKVVATRGSQTKTVYTDGLGRKTETITPDAGTRNYYYDSVSTPGCPSGYTGAIGLLEAVKDANGNKLCYKYDSLNRVIGVNANGTTCRNFYYDATYGTVPSGVTTPTNTNGRIAEATTTNCSSTLYTDEWMSYDSDGNMTDMWETTPNAGRYYHSQGTFAGNGIVTSVKLATPSLNTMTYGLDGEGRWSSMTDSSSSTTIVSGTTYTAAGLPSTISIGSGTDYDSYTYDPNTNRMTGWVFQVGTGSSNQETGTLTWNPSGSLKELQITDGFNSGGSQTCYFGNATGPVQGYDDYGRLTDVDCGTSGWGQTFTYDQNDNLTKTKIPADSIGLTFNPGYNSSSNQYASGYGATYDSNGNVLYDPTLMNTYAYNEFNRMSSINLNGTGCSTSGTCLIYDAFGRMVEEDTGSTYIETWITQVGRVAFMEGATQKYSLWPTPGGGTSQSGSGYLHKDWLGSARLGSSISASTITFDQAYAPYGDVYSKYGSPSFGCCGGSETTFGGNTQDVTTGIFNTPNRELGASQGRWFSPDPAQSGWNPYAYAPNPNSMIDPSGLSAKPLCAAAGRVGLRPAGCNGVDPGDPDGPGDAGDGSDGGQGPDDGGDGLAGGTVGADGGLDPSYYASSASSSNGGLVFYSSVWAPYITYFLPSGDPSDTCYSCGDGPVGGQPANNQDPSKTLQQQLKNQSDQCSKAASAAAAPYFNSLKWPSANAITGGVVLGGVAKMATKSTPWGIAISFATVFREQIGATVNGSLAYASSLTGCSMTNGAPGTGFF